jgi:hypothetical protein
MVHLFGKTVPPTATANPKSNRNGVVWSGQSSPGLPRKNDAHAGHKHGKEAKIAAARDFC